MKNILFSIGLLFAALKSFGQADTSLFTVTANTVSNYLSGRFSISEMTFANGNTTNAAILKFYDWHTAATNVLRPAHTVFVSYETNYSTVHTNQAGLLTTNTFTGWYSAATTVDAATSEQTRLATVTIPANQTRTLEIPFVTARGLTLLSSQAGTLEVTYRTLP